jgi:cytochrome P450
MNQWVTHHDDRYWSDGYSFKPERWIGDGFGHIKDAFQPFSLGPRRCIGVNLAYLEIRIILAKIVWMYDLELVNRDVDLERDSRLYLLWKTPKVMVRYRPRN